MTVFFTNDQCAEILALSPLATSGTARGMPSVTQFVLGAFDAIRFAQRHCTKRAGWIAFLREAVALRARVQGRLGTGKTVDASPLTLTERARLDPLATSAEMRDAWTSAGARDGAAESIGVTPEEWTAALRALPDLAAELRGDAS